MKVKRDEIVMQRVKYCCGVSSMEGP